MQNHLSDVTPKIINISSYDLTRSEISILAKGTKFCPTPIKKDVLNLQVDINVFLRKILLLDQFGSRTSACSSNIDQSLVKKSGTFIPKDSQDIFLQTNVNKLREWAKNLNTLHVEKVPSNITEAERQAITSLNNNKNIVIRPVDKGGGIVVMDKDYYVQKAEEVLSDASTYKKLNNYSDISVMKEVTKFCENYKNVLTDEERLYLQKFDFKTSNFYGNPKIHKSQVINNLINSVNNVYIKITENVDLSFRYITTSINAPVGKLSEFFDILLKPFLQLTPSYIRDAIDFLIKKPVILNNRVELDDIIFVSVDVTGMYVHITLELGLEAISYWLDTYPHLLHGRFNKTLILEGIALIMKNSCFAFNDKYYCLNIGTATGTTVAPTYANLVMAYLETKMYKQVLEVFGVEGQKFVLKNWFRFLDDGIILWKKSLGDVKLFIDILNNLHPNLTFTYEINSEKISFLNVLLYKENNTLKSDIFYKKTDSHDYLPFGSCHPRHTKHNIPYTLARMICTIVEDPVRKRYRLEELRRWLLKSGYPSHVINWKFNMLKDMDIHTLRQKVIHEQKQLLVFVQDRNPANPSVFSHIRNFIETLKTDERMSSLLSKVDIIKSERQSKNLGNLLQHSYFGTEKFEYGVKKCGASRCITCSYIEEGESVYFPHVDTHFKIRHKFNCNSGYLLYKIRCKGCNQDIPGSSGYYIGRTTCLKERLYTHKKCVLNEHYRNQNIYIHIFSCAGHLPVPFTIMPFYKVKRESISEMQIFEQYFREKFKPDLNTL